MTAARKISALPHCGLLTGVEHLPLVQGGTTVRATLDELPLGTATQAALASLSGTLTAALARKATATAVNVKDAPHSATGDGTTDDTAALLSAIAACGEGQCVLFPPGTYLISTPLSLTRNQTLQGTHTAWWPYDGGNPSTIKSALGFSGAAMLLIQDMEQAGLSQEQDGIRVHNMSFDNNNVGATTDCILLSGQVRDFAMHDVTLSRATGSGVHAVGYTRTSGYVHPKGFNLHRCVSWACHNNGFSLNDTTDTIMFSCLAVSNFANGFFLTGAGECQYFACRSVFNGAAGFVYTGVHTGAVFVSCTTDRNDKNGFVMSATGPYSVVFFGFQARRDGKNGSPGAGGGGFSGLSIQGTVGTLASPVVIDGLIEATGINDDGVTGAVSPQYGISSIYCRFLSVKGNLWGASSAYHDGGGNTTVRFDPANLYTTGGPTAPVRDSSTVAQDYEGALATSPLLSTRVTGDATPQWTIAASGKQTFAGDALLYRSQARTLRTDAAWATGISAQTLASNGAVTVDASTGNVQVVTLQADATSATITNPSPGQTLTLAWQQDATGSRAYAWPPNCSFTNGAAPLAVTSASGRDVVTFYYNGSLWVEVARTSQAHAVPKSLVDAKGDILVGTADNVIARKAVGADETVLVADTATTEGVRWAVPRLSLQQSLMMPTGAIAEVGMGRCTAMTSQAVLTSGTLRLCGLMVLPKGRPINTITMYAGSTAAITPTHQWFALVRVSDLAVLAKTANDLTTPWAGGAAKALTTAAPYTPADHELAWAAVLVVAGTVPTMIGWSVGVAAVVSAPPVLCGNSTAGLTTPASLGATAAAPSAGALTASWGYVS